MKRTSPVTTTSPNPARDPGWQFDGAPNGIRVRLRRPRLRAHSALARSLGNARAFPQSRDPNGFEPRPVNVTSPNPARDPGWQFDGAPFAHLLEPRCAQSARLSSLGYHERPRKQPGACRDRSDSGLRCRSWRRDPDRSCRTLRRFRKGCRRFAPRTPARFRPAR